MEWYSFEFWEIVLDVIGLCLVGMVIIYLIRNKAAYNQSLLENEKKPELPKDISEFHDLLLKSLEQSEIAFETVSDALKKERRILQQLKQAQSGGDPPDQAPAQPNHGHFPDEKYEKVSALHRSGLNADQIARRVDISKSEIELIVKLNSEDDEPGESSLKSISG